MNKIFLLTIALLLSSYAQAFAILCRGTEPFWSASVSDTSIEMELFGTEKKSISIKTTGSPRGMTEEFIKIYYDEKNKPVATVLSDECNDGMSDFIYEKEVIIYMPEETFYGCCGDPNKPSTAY